MIQIDMPMPKSCYECKFSDDSGDYPFCWALQQNRGYRFDRRTKRFPNCPLKPMEEQQKDSKNQTMSDKDICRVLFNRCRAVGSADGALCFWCGMKKQCDEMRDA